jgi:hypothetical protein
LRNADLVTSAACREKRLAHVPFCGDRYQLSAAHELDGSGATTRIHSSITAMLGSLHANEGARALILFSDGHDFELTNPAKTGLLRARAKCRSLRKHSANKAKFATRFGAYHELPAIYLREQKPASAHRCDWWGANWRSYPSLKREGRIVQTQVVQSGEESEIAIHFDVMSRGSYEYEVRVVPLNGEVDEETIPRSPISTSSTSKCALSRGRAVLGHHLFAAIADAK